MIYLLTVLRGESEEVFQREFSHLPDALDFANERYGHWDFTDTTEAPQEGGCGSCSNNNK